jgi:hypothetical protein
MGAEVRCAGSVGFAVAWTSYPLDPLLRFEFPH